MKSKTETAAPTLPVITRLGVSPRFPKVANYLKTYTLAGPSTNWSSELIPELDRYGRGEAGSTLRGDGKVTQQFSTACMNLHHCATALQWHAVQSALGSKRPQARGAKKPVTAEATRREFGKLIKNGKHIHAMIWPPAVEQYFDKKSRGYDADFAKELDGGVSKGEFMIVRHLLLQGHVPETLEAALLEFGPGLVNRKGKQAGAYAADTLKRALADETLKTWMAERKAAQDDAQALADSDVDWLDFWRRSVAYRYWSFRMAHHSRGMLYWLFGVANTAACCLALGWTDYALTLFHQLANDMASGAFVDYDNAKKPFFQRRTQYFLLRLIADWQGITPPVMPRQADDEPLFTALLAHWQTHDLEVLTPLLLAACDRHTHLVMIRKDSPDFHTSGDLAYIPFEILALLRLRQTKGLPVPVLDHPLMATPFGTLPPLSEPYRDELLDSVIAQARKEFASL